MSRESIEDKSKRIVVEGRLTVEQAGPGFIAATVRGDGDIHHCGYQRGGWHCTCPSRGRCSHLIALGLVSAPRRTP